MQIAQQSGNSGDSCVCRLQCHAVHGMTVIASLHGADAKETTILMVCIMNSGEKDTNGPNSSEKMKGNGHLQPLSWLPQRLAGLAGMASQECE